MTFLRTSPTARVEPTRVLLSILFFCSGFCSLLYQIVWLRVAFAYFGVVTPVLSVVISVRLSCSTEAGGTALAFQVRAASRGKAAGWGKAADWGGNCAASLSNGRNNRSNSAGENGLSGAKAFSPWLALGVRFTS